MCWERTSQLNMRVRFHKKTVLSLLLLISALFICYYFIETYVLQLSIARYKLVELAPHKQNAEKKHILFWTKFFEIPRWGLDSVTLNEEFFKSMQCSVTNCILTHDKQLLSAPHLYDAIIFHTAETWMMLDLPKTRSPHQHYVMATLE
jgi:alpha-1,3-fucosyltransferase